MTQDPVAVANRVVDFMGVKQRYTTAMMGRHVNQWSAPYKMYDQDIEKTMAYLREFYAPYDEELYELMDEVGVEFPRFEIEDVSNGEKPEVEWKGGEEGGERSGEAERLQLQRCATEMAALRSKEMRMRRGCVLLAVLTAVFVATYVVIRWYGRL